MELRTKQAQTGTGFIFETFSHDVSMSMAWGFYTSEDGSLLSLSFKNCFSITGDIRHNISFRCTTK